MDRLWAPWRFKYVSNAVKGIQGCVFCRILNEKKDKKNLVIIRSRHAYSVLNIFPYNNGHTLIVSNRHVNDLSKLKREEREDLMDLLEETKTLFSKTLKPGGYNVGINLGRTAGAGFPGHLHIHLVPRWKGDINFMPVTANTKVISQSLTALYAQLSHAHQKRL